MKSYGYLFCGVPILVTSPRPIWEDEQALLFRTEIENAEITVQLAEAETLSKTERQVSTAAGTIGLTRSGDRILRQTKDRFCALPHIEAEYSVDAPVLVRATARREDWLWATRTQYLWTGIALNQLLLHFQTLFFHGSYIAWKKQGILFTAPSGVGKSTQAELWRVHRGAEIINGDKAGVTLRESPMIHGIPFSGTSGICKNRSLPLRAVVVLSQSPDNSVRLLRPAEAVAAICQNVFADQLVPEEWTMALNLMLDLTASVPVLALACTPDERAVETLERYLETINLHTMEVTCENPIRTIQ